MKTNNSLNTLPKTWHCYLQNYFAT